MPRKQIRDDDFLAAVPPRVKAGAPRTLLEAADKLRYAVWINARTDISLRIIALAYRHEVPDLVDKAFHVMVLELQDAAVVKLDALYDTKDYRVCIPTIISPLREERSWIDQSGLTTEMLLQQVDERLKFVKETDLSARVGRWRNDEAGHIAWSTDQFRQTIYQDLIRLHDETCHILRNLFQLVFGHNLEETYGYRIRLAEAMSGQLLRGRCSQLP